MAAKRFSRAILLAGWRGGRANCFWGDGLAAYQSRKSKRATSQTEPGFRGTAAPPVRGGGHSARVQFNGALAKRRSSMNRLAKSSAVVG